MNLISNINAMHADYAEMLATKVLKRLNCNDVFLIMVCHGRKMEKVVTVNKAMHRPL
jgi:hypothetical protein